MRLIQRLLMLSSVLLWLGCGDDPTGPDETLGLLVGSWAAESFVFSANGDSIDLVELGGAMNVEIAADGRVTVDTREPGAGGFVEQSGTVSVPRPGVMRLAVEDPVELSYEVSATELRFTGPGSADIDGDGTDDPVAVNGRFVRRSP